MSLINEALKRAKEAQQSPQTETSSARHLGQFQPVHSHPGTGFLPLITLALVALLGTVVGWQWFHMRKAPVGPIATRVVSGQPKNSNLTRPATPVSPAPVAPAPQPVVKPSTSTAAAPTRSVPLPVPPPNAAKPVAATQRPTSVQTAATPSNPGKPVSAPATTKEPAPKPVVLKLQAVVMHPTRPSAVINGKSLFVGDHISEFRVTNISPQSVTLVKAGRATVLNLGE